MLVLTRRLGEGLIIGDNVKITVEKISKSETKIGIEAPNDVIINREEGVWNNQR
ncbi:MAG: carbon storage regulator [Planctomycetota bacterium]|jgi:carbon storage regulator